MVTWGDQRDLRLPWPAVFTSLISQEISSTVRVVEGLV